MVLLRGLNYDFSGQQNSILTHEIGKGQTTLRVENSEGFSDDDYIVIDPYTEKAEIIRINDTVSDTKSLTITATKFVHAAKSKFYRLPYNQMRFYSCAEVSGTYTLIASSETEMTLSDVYTVYNYAAGTSALYYKRTFYNSTSLVESDITVTSYWQTSDEELYVTPSLLRSYMQLMPNDYPTDTDLWNFIRIAQDKFTLDVSTTNSIIKRLAVLFLSKSFVLRGLATKSVAKGYVTVNAEGRQITKAFQELVLEAENTEEEYKMFILNNARMEATSTNFMSDSTIIDSETRQEYIDNMNGTQNAMDYDSKRTYTGRRARY